MKDYNVIGEVLELVCIKYFDWKIYVRVVDDFKLVLEGGCILFCKFWFFCGYSCIRVCYFEDSDYVLYKC